MCAWFNKIERVSMTEIDVATTAMMLAVAGMFRCVVAAEMAAATVVWWE